MNIEDLRSYCLSFQEVSEGFPFDESTLVFKVLGKMFALTSLNSEDLRVNLKCDPERALELRATHPSIIPGYHMNKQHWNTVIIDGSLPDDMIRELIDHSYDLIVASLPKSKREIIGRQDNNS